MNVLGVNIQNDNNATKCGTIYGFGRLINNTFINNHAVDGGGVFLNSNSYENSTVNHVFNCIFINNTASSKGGAIYHSTNNIHIFNSDFINNTANDKGGAVYFNGNRLNLINDTFKYNYADNSTNNTGDAIFIDGYRAILTIVHVIQVDQLKIVLFH